MKRWVIVLACVFSLTGAEVLQSSAADAPSIVVGRVYHTEGDLLRYVPEEKDWVAMVPDAPFGAEDVLYSGSRGTAELIVPNGSWIRIGNSTQIQFIVLDEGLSEADVAAGIARFSNRSSDTLVKATSPFGYVLADPGTAFDIIVGDDSVEVIALKGRVSFFHSAMEAKFDVAAGSPSILADQTQVSPGEGATDPDWDRWNGAREDFWVARAREGGRSAEYLPPGLHDEAYALEQNGRWEMISYEGTEQWFWQPTAVDAGWAPFTVGRWTDWYGEQTWIPAEPFGYITHHYGNWIYTRNHWYWAPPVARVRVGLPLLNVGFHWYPGRVSWIHTGSYIGWVPLAPYETYYCRRRWGGPHTTVVSNVNIPHISINVRNYAYLSHAIVVNRSNFFKVNNYRRVRMSNVSRATIINTYRAAPVINNTVIRNYAANRQRYTYTNRKVNEKPHRSVIDRIQRNRSIIGQERAERGTVVQERAKGAPEGKVNREARIEQPRVTNYIVPAGEVNRPKGEVRFQLKEFKRRGEGSAGPHPTAAGKPEPLPAQPERVTTPKRPVQPIAPGKPGVRSESATPERRSPPVQPGQSKGPTQVKPVMPVPPAKPRVLPGPAAPERSPQPGQPAQSDGATRVRPAISAQSGQPGSSETRPERVTPPQPGQPVSPGQPVRPKPEQPAVTVPPAAHPEQGERARRGPLVRPPQPVQPVAPAAQPERVLPARPSQPVQPVQPPQPAQSVQQPAARPGRVIPAQPSQSVQPVQTVQPTPPVQPATQPEGVAPAPPSPQEQPGQLGRPGVRPGRTAPARPGP